MRKAPSIHCYKNVEHPNIAPNALIAHSDAHPPHRQIGIEHLKARYRAYNHDSYAQRFCDSQT